MKYWKSDTLTFQALVTYGIAKISTRKTANKKSAPAISVTRDCGDDPALFRMFKLMFKRLREKNVVFDPLNKFDREGDAGDEQDQ